MANYASSSNRHLVQYYDELVDYISLKIGNRQIAADVVQETYLRVFQRPEQFVDLVYPIAFLKKVSINIAFDFLKRHKTYDKYFDSFDPENINFMDIHSEIIQFSEQELSVARVQYAQIILKAISNFPPACQDVFLLVQFYGMTQVDVAKQLGISRTMVIKHFTRALQYFAQLFEDEQNESKM
jgi:RNA polymerase sigma factor (sigma-70 family)